MIGHGLVLSACVLGAMALALGPLGLDAGDAVTVSFLTLALGQLWHVFNMRAAGSHWLRNEVTTNLWVWAALALCLGLIAAATWVPVMAGVLQLNAPDTSMWLVILPMSIVPLVAAPLVRRFAAGR